MDFTRLKNYKPDYKGYSYSGARYPVSVPELTSSEGKKRLKKNLGISRVAGHDSSDGKVTWTEYFSHPDTPAVIFMIYDYKGWMSCGLGISHAIAPIMEEAYKNKLDRMLAELVTFTLGG